MKSIKEQIEQYKNEMMEELQRRGMPQHQAETVTNKMIAKTTFWDDKEEGGQNE